MYRNPKKAFLVGGDVFALDTSDILEIIKEIKNEFPMIERISSYCSAINVMKKSKEDLTKLREAGVSLLYLGIESGSDVVLEGMCKGVTKAEQLEACKTLQAVGFDLSVMVISGLGGKVHSTEHALESADIISKINPKYFSLLSLEIRGEQYLRGMKTRFDFEEMTPSEIIDETILMLGMIETKDCVFRSNHASNYVRLAGTLSDDKEELIKTLHEVKEYYFK
jgi:radical SAM superfamily enzyme YgiQ (UPF0313 family)